MSNTVMNLGHLVVPRESAGQMLLHTEAGRRQQSIEIAEREIKEVFGTLNLPDAAYTEVARRIVAAIDVET